MSYRILPFILISTVFFFQCSPKILQVHDEPMHRPVFESKKARILDVRFPPGDTCFFHQHSENYYYVALQGGKCFVQNQGKEGRVLTLPTGYSGGKFDMPKEQFIHRIANLDTDTIKYIAVENLKPRNKKKFERMSYSMPGVQVLETNASFEVLKLSSFNYNVAWDFKGPALIVNPSEQGFKINSKLIEKPWYYSEKNINFQFPNPYKGAHEVFLIKLR